MVQLTEPQRAAAEADFRRRLESCTPWTRKVRWQPHLNIQATTYPTTNLFPGLLASERDVDDLRPSEFVDSPGGNFRYAVRLHRRGRRLQTWWGRQTGDVLFDGDIEIPILFERAKSGRWNTYPWMSLTPAELLTLRPGTRLARGKVVIGGLGLAHQLLEVSKRNAVTEIVVVERSHELCDLIMPRVLPTIAERGKKIVVRIGDALNVLPTLRADVALVDVFPTYQGNHDATAELARTCRNIKKVWGWGTSEDR